MVAVGREVLLRGLILVFLRDLGAISACPAWPRMALQRATRPFLRVCARHEHVHPPSPLPGSQAPSCRRRAIPRRPRRRREASCRERALWNPAAFSPSPRRPPGPSVQGILKRRRRVRWAWLLGMAAEHTVASGGFHRCFTHDAWLPGDRAVVHCVWASDPGGRHQSLGGGLYTNGLDQRDIPPRLQARGLLHRRRGAAEPGWQAARVRVRRGGQGEGCCCIRPPSSCMGEAHRAAPRTCARLDACGRHDAALSVPWQGGWGVCWDRCMAAAGGFRL